jgi:hypothetical protein
MKRVPPPCARTLGSSHVRAVSLLLATACLLTSAGKLLGHPKMRQSAAHFGIPWRKYQLIGAAELAAAGVLLGLRWHPLGWPSPGRLIIERLAASQLARAAPPGRGSARDARRGGQGCR